MRMNCGPSAKHWRGSTGQRNRDHKPRNNGSGDKPMLPASQDEWAAIIGYYLSQSPGAEVTFLQKVYTEAVLGHRHDVWDVHASDGRWSVITNPTNLYSQAQFPNMDLAVTFHMGLSLRIPRTQRQRSSD